MATPEPKLSSDEMAALKDMATPEEGQEVSVNESAKVQVSSYNFRQPGRLSAAQLRALRVVHEYFSKRLTDERPSNPSLSADLSMVNVETVSYSNFMGSLGNPCFLMQLASRFEHPVMMEIDLPTMKTLVSRILGDNDEEAASGEEKEVVAVKALTSIEQAIAADWLEALLPMLGESWELSSPVDFKMQHIDSDPRFVQVMPDDSPVVSVTFRFLLGTAKGQLTLCYPLEPLQELLEGMSLKMRGSDEEEETGEQDGSRILASLKSVPFEMRAELGCCSIQARQLASLQLGDVLCLDRTIHDSVDVFLEDNQVFSARLGKKGDNMALQIAGRKTERKQF